MGIQTDVASEVSIIENWLKTQLHLPQYIEQSVLERFLNACGNDIEKTKKLIDLNYTMRNNYDHIFIKRDPASEETRNIINATDILTLPGLTPEGNKVLFYRLADANPEKYNFNEAVKLFFMFADIRFITPDPAGKTRGEIPIFDMTGYTLRHMTKVVLSTLRIYMKFTQEAHPVQLKGIHVINVPSYLDKVMTVIKPFIKSEVFKLIKFHLPESQTLYQSVPKDLLPNEYGGKAGTVEEIKKKWVDVLMQKRDYLTNEKYWKINEKLRTQRKEEVFSGNFRSLSID